jgi:hypothetical protein
MKSTRPTDFIGKLMINDTGPTLFEKELKATGLDIFTDYIDKGFFAWKAAGPLIKLDSISSAGDIRRLIDTKGEPNNLVLPIDDRLPLKFRKLVPDEHENKFPYGQLDIASLHVAAKSRGVSWDDIDFCFGGSTLEMLANQDDSNPYAATKIPGTDTVLVVKNKFYTNNHADFGFQFERLVTGHEMDDRSQWEFTEHLHVMKIGKYRVLFRAEVDAMQDEEPVEIKAANPRYWGTKVMFQMISSGSPSLCHGVKGRGGQLTGIDIRCLSSVAKEALSGRSMETLEANILEGMDKLRDVLLEPEENEIFKISFASGSLDVLPVPTRGRSSVILPKPEIVKDLIL